MLKKIFISLFLTLSAVAFGLAMYAAFDPTNIGTPMLLGGVGIACAFIAGVAAVGRDIPLSDDEPKKE